jgi:hypothetical protein
MLCLEGTVHQRDVAGIVIDNEDLQQRQINTHGTSSFTHGCAGSPQSRGPDSESHARSVEGQPSAEIAVVWMRDGTTLIDRQQRQPARLLQPDRAPWAEPGAAPRLV